MYADMEWWTKIVEQARDFKAQRRRLGDTQVDFGFALAG